MTIQANMEKMKNLGIKRIVSSMASMVESTKERRRKRKSLDDVDEVDEYIPSEKDLREAELEKGTDHTILRKVIIYCRIIFFTLIYPS
jgi:hypothetical protein